MTETAAHRVVVAARDGAVVTLTVNRPDARNALDGPTVDALTAAFEAIDRDAGVRCAILTGAGDRAFVAGADIKAMAGLDAGGRARLRGARPPHGGSDGGDPRADHRRGQRLRAGRGLELALACDFIYAARDREARHARGRPGRHPRLRRHAAARAARRAWRARAS